MRSLCHAKTSTMKDYMGGCWWQRRKEQLQTYAKWYLLTKRRNTLDTGKTELYENELCVIFIEYGFFFLFLLERNPKEFSWVSQSFMPLMVGQYTG